MKFTPLPAQFQVPFIGLLVLLMIAVYELIAPTDRTLWLVIAGATVLGAYQKPAAAAALGWILVILLGIYLAINSALAPVTGASWLTLLVVPWLPPFASNVVDAVRLAQARLQRQEKLILAQASLHPSTNLPGIALAEHFLPLLNSNIRRQNHQGSLIEVEIANLELLRPLTTPEQLTELQAGVRDNLRSIIRGSDWLFHIRDNALLVVADLGDHLSNDLPLEVQELYQDVRSQIANLVRDHEPLRRAASHLLWEGNAEPEDILIQKLHSQMNPPPQVELRVRSMPLPEQLPPFEVLLSQLATQPSQPLGTLQQRQEQAGQENPSLEQKEISAAVH